MKSMVILVSLQNLLAHLNKKNLVNILHPHIPLPLMYVIPHVTAAIHHHVIIPVHVKTVIQHLVIILVDLVQHATHLHADYVQDHPVQDLLAYHRVAIAIALHLVMIVGICKIIPHCSIK